MKTLKTKALDLLTNNKMKILKSALLVFLGCALTLGIGRWINGDDEVDNSEVLREHVSQISELTITRLDYTYIEEFSDNAKANLLFTKVDIPLTNKYFLGTFDGIIKYGIDLAKVETKDIHIDDDKKEIKITVPEIIEISHETGKTKFYAQDNNLFNPFTPEDSENFKQKHKANEEKKAIKDGIIERVHSDTELFLTKWVTGTFEEYKDYKVIVDFPEQDTIEKGELTIVNK